MEFNTTILEENITLSQVTKYFNISISNLTNQSQETQIHLFDLYEAYRTKEKEQLMFYKFVAYVVGTLIILSNLTVVISSGLILRKGQQPKSTYLLLGNVSLADTIIGISIIFGAVVDNSMSSNPLCIFQIGMLVCPAMVSIFSVGLIAVDRYIYILHGMYYQRWFNTTKVRIGIVCIWMIGVTLGFMPATGWVNRELHSSRCSYIGLFPGSLILLNSLLSIVPIIVVAVLYCFILVKALANVKNIKASERSIKKTDSNDPPKLRIYRGNGNSNDSGTYSVKYPKKNYSCKLCRSASLSDNYINQTNNSQGTIQETKKSKSINDLFDESTNQSSNYYENTKIENQTSKPHYDSKFSICTIESSCDPNCSVNSDLDKYSTKKSIQNPDKSYNKRIKSKKPNKWRAITVVMLTSGSFIFTWLPFFITVIFFVFCEEKLTNPKCMRYRMLLRGPMATLAFFNSILNPLIYAWWHKGFQRSMRTYFEKYMRKYFSKNILLTATIKK